MIPPDDPDLQWTVGPSNDPHRQPKGTLSVTVRHPDGRTGWALCGPTHRDKDEAMGRLRALARLNFYSRLDYGDRQ